MIKVKPPKSPFLPNGITWNLGWAKKAKIKISLLDQDHVALGIVFIYMICGAFLLSFHPYLMAKSESDAIEYLIRSENLWDIYPYHGPGFAWAIALFKQLGIKGVIAGKLISLLSGVAILCSFWKILKTLNTPLKLLSLGLLAFNPVFLVESVRCMSDMMATAALYVGLILLISPKLNESLKFLLIGALTAIGYLTRGVVLYSMLGSLIVFLLYEFHSRNLKVMRRLIFFVIAFLVTSGPWLLNVYKEKGSPFWNHNHITVALSIHKDLVWADIPSIEEYPNMASVILDNPEKVIKYWVTNLIDIPKTAENVLPVFGYFALIGFVIMISNLSKNSAAIISGIGVYALLICLIYFSHRFWLPILPVIAIFSAYGLNLIPKKVNPYSINRIPFKWSIISVLGILFIVQTGLDMKQRFKDRPPEWPAVYSWLRNETKGSEKIIASVKPHFSYFSQNIYYPLHKIKTGDKPLENTAKILRDENVDYFIVEQRVFTHMFPQMKGFLLPEKNVIPDQLELVYRNEKPAKIYVYKVKH